MGTLMDAAKRGVITEEMKIVAEKEGVSPEFVRDQIARGRIIIPLNVVRRDRDDIRIEGIGEGLRTKVNANVGTSTLVVNPEMELEKLRVAIKYGADSVMDLSTGGDLDAIRRMLIKEATVMFGTVPVYQAFIDVAKREGAGIYMTEDDILKTIEKQLKDGVDFMTLHAGVTLNIAKELVKAGGRGVTGVPSRGGTILLARMLYHNEENPLYKNRGYILELMREYDAAVSLGDGLRPAGIADSHDRFQIAELLNNAKLVQECRKAGVQVMVEGPGHVPMDMVEADVKLEKRVTKGAPYYVLGPIVTDIFPGYDHITSAIGGALAAAAGADMLCYVTPAEHLSLPNVEQVKEGVIAARIAAHAGDIVKLGERAARIDYEMDKARAALDRKRMREIAPDKETFDRIRGQFVTPPEGMCTMCGELCVYLLLDKYLKKNKRFL